MPLPSFSLCWWLTLQHILAEISSHAPERERERWKERERWCCEDHMCFATCSVYAEPALISILALSISLKNVALCLFIFLSPALECAFVWVNSSAFCKHGASGAHRNTRVYSHSSSLFLIIPAWAKQQAQPLWKGAVCRPLLCSPPDRLPSAQRSHSGWHLQRCWNPPCTCCRSAALWPLLPCI